MILTNIVTITLAVAASTSVACFTLALALITLNGGEPTRLSRIFFSTGMLLVFAILLAYATGVI